MENKKENPVPISDQDLCAEALLMWSLKVQELPPEFLMMNAENPYYHEFQKWLTKYQLALHCITDLEIGCCENLAEITIEKYITDSYRKEIQRMFDKKAKRGQNDA